MNSTIRLQPIKNEYDDGLDQNDNPYRTEYRRDYARVLHCASFRRLGNKTQLFPAYESDFFRTRLTHSLEVAQIARSIAEKFLVRNKNCSFIEPTVCEVAGLVHDIGHPPFGHNGERALDDCMKKYGGFEGNAQTLHIIARLEKKELPREHNIFDKNGCDTRCGLNLTVRSIASCLKYDEMIRINRKKGDCLQKGYYSCDKEIVKYVKNQLVGDEKYKPFKTIECAIMDIADDIAYSTYDLEDAFKAGFLTPNKIAAADKNIYEQISEKLKGNGIKISPTDCRNRIYSVFGDIWEEIFQDQKKINKRDINYIIKSFNNYLNAYRFAEEFAKNGYLRTRFTSMLVSRFIEGVDIKLNEKFPLLSEIVVEEETKVLINILKHFSYVCLINSARLKVVENRGYDIVKELFKRFEKDGGERLLPEDFQAIYGYAKDETTKKRVICDFIAGMTDRYALEFYGRLFSENPQTIFKPL